MQGRKPTRKFWAAFDGLYGDKLSTPIVASKLPRKSNSGAVVKPKPLFPTEQHEQFVVSAWLRKNNIIHNHSPNGGHRDIREGAKFKRLGTSAGFPDLEIPYPRKGYHGLYIELKRIKGGVLSDSQVYWRDFLLSQGYAWYEAKGAAECIRIVENYFAC